MKNLKKIFANTLNQILSHFHIKIGSIYSSGRSFSESFKYLKKILPSPSPEKKLAVIDIGVAHGTPELWEAFPSSKYSYLLIEANPAYAQTVEKQGADMNAVVEKVFCGDHDGLESFITDVTYDPGKASKYSRKMGGEETRTEIPCNTLDTILARHKLPATYIIKIDVEGAELDVLRGAQGALKNTEAVILETPVILRKSGASSFGEIVAYMHQQGFVVFDIAEMSYHHKNGFLNLANAIFVKKNNELWLQKTNSKK